MSGLRSLRRFAGRAPEARAEPGSGAGRCELCAAPIRGEHPHLIDPASRKLSCACDGCSILFDSGGRTKLRRVPREVRRVSALSLPNESPNDFWERLLIPINLAFFYRSSAAGQVIALYPSPAGVTESQLGLEAWGEVTKRNPELDELREDIEGLLVNRLKGRSDYYIAPIDQCFELVGIIRKGWRGFTGGDRVWEEIHRFFDRLSDRSRERART